MFKLVTTNENIKNKLQVVDATDYRYVMTDEVSNFEDGKINILITDRLLDEAEKMIDTLVNGEDLYLVASDERGQKRVLVDQIQYVESVGDEVYIQMKENRFVVRSRLYQVEEVIMKKNFIRISKSHIVNLKKIDVIKPAINSKIILVMKNGDEVEVKRTYLKDFKNALQL